MGDPTRPGRPRRSGYLAVLVFFGLGCLVVARWEELSPTAHWYGIAVFALLGVKLAGSVLAKVYEVTPYEQPTVANKTVAAVIPVRNEDPETLRRSLESLLAQTRPVDAIVLVDDASDDKTCLRIARAYRERFERVGVDFRIVEFAVNRGKRHGIGVAVRQFPRADVYLGVDSDTVLHPDAVREGMKPFADPRIKGVTGLVLALNADKNLLTRLIDVRYANAFLYERAAYSSVGSVLCACGSLAFYDGPVVREHLEDFLTQRFLGRQATYGDDRRLTNYCLLAGQVVFQSSAVAWTLVPERMGHFLRQQIRWNKSFFRESLWVLRHMGVGRAATWLTGIELTSWLVFTTTLLWAMLVAPFTVGWHVWVGYLGFVGLLGWVRSVRYLEMAGSHARSRRERLLGFTLAPLYSLLHMAVLLPLRLWSLVTLRDNGWATRATVEVGVESARPKVTA